MILKTLAFIGLVTVIAIVYFLACLAVAKFFEVSKDEE